jgi:hypothetical protein
MARLLLLAFAFTLLLAPGTAAAQYELSAYSTCAIIDPQADPDSAWVIWTTYEPFGPDQHPNWVGYDIYRRRSTPCGDPFVRVNDQIIPRNVGMTHTHYFGDLLPATATLFEYWVRPVDADRQQYFVGGGFCIPCNTFQICPQSSAPITIGTIDDWGWAVFVNPCPGSCYPGAYVSDQAIADALRPYAGSNTVFRFYGTLGCGTIEGCALNVESYGPTTCVVPAASRSWGSLKTLYR